MTDTDAQAAALDEAIEVALDAAEHDDTTTTQSGIIAAAVRAAAPIIRRQAEAERDELQAAFDVQWNASRRATKRWQDAHPGNDLVWPDAADLMVWLMDRLAAAEAAQADAEWELSNMRAAHDSACRTVADMHAAAVGGERSGPIRGVVEDVADVRAHLDGMRDKFRRLAAEISTGWEPLEQEGGLVYTAYKNAFKEAARRINVILEEES